MALRYRLKSPEALAGAYARAAALCLIRQERDQERGHKQKAKGWKRLAEYCTDMARSRAVDDDQYQFQRDKIRWRKLVFAPPEVVQALAPSVPGPDEPRRTVEPWEEALMELALGHLSEQQRICYEMAVGGGLTPPQIAQTLGMPNGQVHQHLARARRRIAEDVTARLTAPPIYTGPDGATVLGRLLDAILGTTALDAD